MAFLKRSEKDRVDYRSLPDGGDVEERGTLLVRMLSGVAVGLIYKHSPSCFISLRARQEVETLMRRRSDIPVYLVDVLRERPLSRWLAQHFDITHHSPQVLILREGRPVWHASHGRVRADHIASNL